VGALAPWFDVVRAGAADDRTLGALADTHALTLVTGGQAYLLRPVTVAQIDAWANERRRMPPKTTFFSPKPRTGMVFRSLDLP
jgi:hypothetical protein